MTSLTSSLLSLVENPSGKSILELGDHDDITTLELAKHFRQVYSYYEFLKIPDHQENNITIKKLPYPEVLKMFSQFDVIFSADEFHHFPDIWQMQTYDKLNKNQILLLKEWNFTGTMDKYYSAFQNCRPLCQLTRDILQQFTQKGFIKVVKKLEGKTEYNFRSHEEITNHFQFILPYHWKFGEKAFHQLVKNLKYPVSLWEGYDLIKIVRL